MQRSKRMISWGVCGSLILALSALASCAVSFQSATGDLNVQISLESGEFSSSSSEGRFLTPDTSTVTFTLYKVESPTEVLKQVVLTTEVGPGGETLAQGLITKLPIQVPLLAVAEVMGPVSGVIVPISRAEVIFSLASESTQNIALTPMPIEGTHPRFSALNLGESLFAPTMDVGTSWIFKVNGLTSGQTFQLEWDNNFSVQLRGQDGAHLPVGNHSLAGGLLTVTTPSPTVYLIAVNSSATAVSPNLNYAFHEIIFDGNGGSGVPASLYSPAFSDVSLSVTEPFRGGYTFGGWNTQADGLGSNYNTGNLFPLGGGPVTLYARWVPESYNIFYTLSGGINHGANPPNYNSESPNIVLQPPTKMGYLFLGWYSDPGFVTSFPSINTGSTGDRYAYANWQLENFSINYVLDGGTNSPQNPPSYNYESPVLVFKPAFRVGHRFEGWFTDGSFTTPLGSIPTNSIGMVQAQAKWTPANYVSPNIGILVYVPAGRFQRDAGPANISEQTKEFRIAQFEVTRAQYNTIMSGDPSSVTNSMGLDSPVQFINWYHAIAFANKLSLLEGLTPVYTVSGVDFSIITHAMVPTATATTWDAAVVDWNANGYRLPTEMEWMWAAMGADGALPGEVNTTGYGKAFAGSDGINLVDDYAWHYDNSLDGADRKSRPVGTKLPNELTIYDMSGNVSEWCWDFYTGSMPGGTLVDYTGPGSGSGRRIRNGSALNVPGSLTLLTSMQNTPESPGPSVGLRLVRN